MPRLMVIVAVLAGVAVGCGGGGGKSNDNPAIGGPASTTKGSTTSRTPTTIESAEAAFRRQADEGAKGQWGLQWQELHPAVQAFVPEPLFIKCSQQRTHGVALNVTGISIDKTYHEQVIIPGTTTTSDSIAITAKITATVGALGPQTQTSTFHEFLVNGQWKFAPSGDVEPYKTGQCPSS